MIYNNDRTIGDYIDNKKRSLAISTTELCRGICSLATYSRLRNSESIPDLLLLNCLLERLGFDPNNINISCSEQEINLLMIRQKIEKLKENDIKHIKQLLSIYISHSRNNILHKQYIDFIQGRIFLFENNKEEAIKYFSSSIERTNLNKNLYDTLVLHRYEFECLYYLCILENDFSQLHALYHFLHYKNDFHYLKRCYYSEISISIAKNLIQNNDTSSAMIIIDNAIKYLQKENQIANLFELLSLKAEVSKEPYASSKPLRDMCLSINTILEDLKKNEHI